MTLSDEQLRALRTRAEEAVGSHWSSLAAEALAAHVKTNTLELLALVEEVQLLRESTRCYGDCPDCTALVARVEAGKALYGLAEYVRAFLSTGHGEDDQREEWRLRLLREIDDQRAQWETAEQGEP